MSVTATAAGTRRRLLGAALASLLALFGAAPALHGPAGPLSRVIVRGAHGALGAVDTAVRDAGGVVVRNIGIVDGAVALVPAAGLPVLSANPVVREVTEDAPIHFDSLAQANSYNQTGDVASAYSTATITGARSYWQAGYTGQGVGIALIDSGVVPVDGLSAPGKVVQGPDLSLDSEVTSLQHLDTFGHGTHMAGLMAGRDNAVVGPYATDTGDFIGMAPDAHVVNIKVADTHGIADVSQVLAGIDWAVQHRNDPGMGIRVINMSFGTDSTQSYVLDPFAYAAEQAWHLGVVVVAATGNAGGRAGVNNPAMDPFVIAVGAADTQATMTTADDTVAGFSSGGDGTRNPDLVAPGVHMQSLRDVGSWLDVQNPQAVLDKRFFRGSGTSQATAVMAGLAALVISQHPGIAPDQLKALLTATATPLAGASATLQGHGEVNLVPVLTAAVPPLTAATQAFVPSTGMGTIDGTRGDAHVQFANGVVVQGEVDVHMNGLAAGPLSQAESVGQTWTGGSFNGALWDGATAPIDGVQWNGGQWSGGQWSGSTWSGGQWSGSTWSGGQWSGGQWSGGQWSGGQWSGAQWSGGQWSGGQWSGDEWSSAIWG